MKAILRVCSRKGLVMVGAAAIVAMHPACSESSSSNASANQSNTIAPASEYDLAAIMNGLGQTLETEKAILSKAIQDWSSITDADHTELRKAFDEQRRLGNEIEAMLRDNPTWVKSTCEWFASVVKPIDEEAVRLRHRLREMKTDPSASRNRYVQLLLDATGSEAAMKEHLRWQTEAPGSPTNVLIMCIKFRHIEDE